MKNICNKSFQQIITKIKKFTKRKTWAKIIKKISKNEKKFGKKSIQQKFS